MDNFENDFHGQSILNCMSTCFYSYHSLAASVRLLISLPHGSMSREVFMTLWIASALLKKIAIPQERTICVIVTLYHQYKDG